MKFVDPLVHQSVSSPSLFHWLAHQSVGARVSQSLQVRTNELLFFSSKLKETTQSHVCSIHVGPSNLHFSNKLLKMNYRRNFRKLILQSVWKWKLIWNHLLLLCKVSCEALVSNTTLSSLAETNWQPTNGYMPIRQMSRDGLGQCCIENKENQQSTCTYMYTHKF